MEKITDSPKTLMDQALQLSNSLTLDELRDKTNIPSSWLRKFRSGRIRNPGVERIERILTAFGVSNISLPIA